MARIWDQENWKLSDRFEITVKKSDSGIDLCKQIYQKNQSIPVCNMVGCKITAIWNFHIYDLMTEDWHNMFSTDIMLGSQPFHVQNDGYVLIVKDRKKTPRELT